ncbi:MAG: T9SS type A sorting domain-containing protein [Cytophagales bacterium]|nr:T9SS type A sorting domain-containing protein [Cytophagales bacterium]
MPNVYDYEGLACIYSQLLFSDTRIKIINKSLFINFVLHFFVSLINFKKDFLLMIQINSQVQINSDNSLNRKNTELYQNYPNPFGDNTNFSYAIEQAGQVELVIHSYFGRYITTLVTEHQDKGSYSIEWNTTDIPPGLYFYTLRVDGMEWVKKAIRIK